MRETGKEDSSTFIDPLSERKIRDMAAFQQPIENLGQDIRARLKLGTKTGMGSHHVTVN